MPSVVKKRGMSFDSGRPVVAPSVGLARSSRVGFGTVANADTNADFVRPEGSSLKFFPLTGHLP